MRDLKEIRVQMNTPAVTLFSFLKQIEEAVKEGWEISEELEHYPRQMAANDFMLTMTKPQRKLKKKKKCVIAKEGGNNG